MFFTYKAPDKKTELASADNQDIAKLETNVKRLLSRCESASPNSSPANLQKYIKNIAVVKEMVDRLEVLKPGLGSQYTKRVANLETTWEKQRAAVSPDRPPALQTTPSHQRSPSNRIAKEQPPLEHLQRKRTNSFGGYRKPESPMARKSPRSPSNAAREALFKGAKMPSEGTEESLDDQRLQQDEMTQQMADMASDLKQTVHRINRHLKAEEKVMEETTDMANRNLNKLRGANKSLSAHMKETSSNTWFTLMMVAVVCMVFLFTYIFMKILPKV